MAGQTFVVEFVEGGVGMVFDGDPAYTLCKELSKKGYVTFIMPRMTFLTGNAEIGYAGPTIETTAWEDQRMMLDNPDMQCSAHYFDVGTSGNLLTCDACGDVVYKPLPRFLKNA